MINIVDLGRIEFLGELVVAVGVLCLVTIMIKRDRS